MCLIMDLVLLLVDPDPLMEDLDLLLGDLDPLMEELAPLVMDPSDALDPLLLDLDLQDLDLSSL